MDAGCARSLGRAATLPGAAGQGGRSGSGGASGPGGGAESGRQAGTARRPAPPVAGSARGLAVVVMAKRPVAGRVKSRLAAAIGGAQAADAYRHTLEETLGTVARVPGSTPILALPAEAAGGSAPSAAGWRPPADMRVLRQRDGLNGGDPLGERLGGVFADLFEEGYEAVVIVASDSPRLPPRFLEQAAEALRGGPATCGRDAVLGPAFDGGYYLVGLSQPAWSRTGRLVESALSAAALGTATAFDDTLRGFRSAGLDTEVLPAWIDLDRVDDLAVAQRLSAAGAAGPAGPAGARMRPSPLRELYLHVTDACGGRCAHCYVPPERGRNEELSTGEWRRVIDQAYDLGTRTFTFIGGDPFLRPDLLELLADVTARADTRARLFFGRHLDRTEARALADAGRGRLLPLLSVDGDQAAHDELRGAGSYAAAFATLSNLRAAGLAPAVNTVLLEPVLPGLPRLIGDLAYAGVRRLHLILPHARGGLTRNDNLIPRGRGLLAGVTRAAEAAARAGVTIDNYSAWRGRLGGSRDLCTAGCSLLAVDAQGRAHACPITCSDPFFTAGDVRTTPLEDIWRRSPVLELLRASSARDRGACRECPVADACGGDCWVQGHYAARLAGGPSGYAAASPYCDFLRPLFEGLRDTMPAGPSEGLPGTPDLTPFDCI